MPIEIRELIIEARLSENKPDERKLITSEDLQQFKRDFAQNLMNGSGSNSAAFRREIEEICTNVIREYLDAERRS